MQRAYERGRVAPVSGAYTLLQARLRTNGAGDEGRGVALLHMRGPVLSRQRVHQTRGHACKHSDTHKHAHTCVRAPTCPP